MPYSPTYSSDPTDLDLQEMLTAAGLWSSGLAVWNQGIVAGAVKRFEMATGRVPFLQQASTSLYYDPPGDASKQMQNPYVGMGKILELTPYFTAITAVAWGVSVDIPAGTPVDIQRQLYFRPNNYAALGLPIEWIEFLFPVYGLPQSIMVTGTPGSVTQWPTDAWNGVLAGAAADLSAVVGTSISGAMTSEAELDTKVTYAENPLAAQEKAWRFMFNRVVKAYKTLRVGL